MDLINKWCDVEGSIPSHTLILKKEKCKMSNVISLCGRKNCCPQIKEDRKKGIMYVIEGKTQIPFNAEQVKNLAKYLNTRGA